MKVRDRIRSADGWAGEKWSARAPRLTEDVALATADLGAKWRPWPLQGSKRVLCRCVRNSLLRQMVKRSMDVQKEALRGPSKTYELEEICWLRSHLPPTSSSLPSSLFHWKSSGTSTANFYRTHKQVHVSRHYYQLLKERLKEMR